MNALKTAQAATIVVLALASLTACQRRDEAATGAAGTGSTSTAGTTPGGTTSGSGTATTPGAAASAASQ